MNAMNQPPFAGVALDKLKRDAEKIKEYARFIIVLEKDGPRLIDNKLLREIGLAPAKIIAVLGPVIQKDALVEESVLLEIGYSYVRPYSQTQGGVPSRWFIKPRRRARMLSDEELRLCYPTLLQCLHDVVEESCAGWKNKTWHLKNGQESTRGIFFTICKSDVLLHRQMVLEDVLYRVKRYLRDHAFYVGRFLKNFRHSHYSVKQLRRSVGVRKVLGLMKQEHYTPFYRAVLCSSFQPGSRMRLLLEQIIDVFKIDVSITAEEEEIISQLRAIPLPRLKTVGMSCYQRPRKRVARAKGASVFELMLNKEVR